jgi:hypothetical protein
MPAIHSLNTCRLDERESAFPQAVQLPDGDILRSFGICGESLGRRRFASDPATDTLRA